MMALGVAVFVVAVLLLAAMSVRVVKQYEEEGVLFRLGRFVGERKPGLRLIIPFVDVLQRISLRIVTMPIQSQGIITRDNVSVDVSAVAYFKVVDATKSVVAIENVGAAINQIAQTTLRKVVGQHTLDETLSERDKINLDIRAILDLITIEWGLQVTLVEFKDIQLPDTMKRAMARQAEAEREKRVKIINAEGKSLAAAALGDASDSMMAHPLALQLRNLQTLLELGVDKNTTVVFPAPLMSTIAELGAFLAREASASSGSAPRARSHFRFDRSRGQRGVQPGEPDMMIVLALARLILLSLWLLRRAGLMREATSLDPSAAPIVPALGLDDSSDCSSATHGSWSAPDERQLISRRSKADLDKDRTRPRDASWNLTARPDPERITPWHS